MLLKNDIKTSLHWIAKFLFLLYMWAFFLTCCMGTCFFSNHELVARNRGRLLCRYFWWLLCDDDDIKWLGKEMIKICHNKYAKQIKEKIMSGGQRSWFVSPWDYGSNPLLFLSCDLIIAVYLQISSWSCKVIAAFINSSYIGADSITLGPIQ